MFVKRDQSQSKKGKLAGLVIAGSMLLWLGMQWVAVELHISARLHVVDRFSCYGRNGLVAY